MAAISADGKIAARRALLFYGSYLRRTHDSNIPSNVDLEAAFESDELAGSDYATKRTALEEALTAVIAPQPGSNVMELIEAA